KGSSKEPARLMWNIETDDVKGEFVRIKGAGATVVQEPYQPGPEGDSSEFWMATFADPDGNYFQIASPAPDM
ncbi:MAG TPA: VOC family protein, partial [Actinomycetota bacterium]|nr:VOC family protein [Actinomycetota bacterium]